MPERPFKTTVYREAAFTRRAAFAATAAVVAVAAAVPAALAQAPVEITFATFLDPNNKNDPRAGAQSRMIEAFEKANPNIKVKVQVDPTQQPSFRALRSKSSTPDVLRFANYSMLEAARTGSIVKLDDLIKRDNVSETDWLLPLSATKVMGGQYGMQQDFRIPVLLYRKSLLVKAGVTPPKTWDEVCAAGGKLNKDNVVGYAVPLGSGGGIGGAQPLAENLFSSMISETSGKYFDDEGRQFLGSKEDFVRIAQTIKDLYGKCGATPQASIQFGYNEVHDGLRAGTVAMATFGLFRYRAIETGGAGEDLGWAPPPAFKPDGKLVVYGFQLVLNANSQLKEQAWQFIKFLTSPEAQAIAAEGGEVVARASVYTTPELAKGVTDRQKAWGELVKQRGRFVGYSILSVNFHQVLGDAMQRMLLSNGTPEAAYDEVVARYGDFLKKAN
jgi:multiple sugar transport system substrate-binding protein